MTETCDFRGCHARALREFWYDSGASLFTCGHHGAEIMQDMPIEERFSMEPTVIMV